jgi:site-specific DNA-methyltransferase (adenine-specific)
MFSFVGDTVVDPFCGTATTMVAALKHGRNSIGIELDTAYSKMAAARLLDESCSIFGNAKLQIEIKPPNAPTESVAILNERGVDYKVKNAKKRNSNQPARH